MKAVLLRDTRVTIKAGEAVELSPAEFAFLVSIGAAKASEEEKPTPKKKTAKK